MCKETHVYTQAARHIDNDYVYLIGVKEYIVWHYLYVRSLSQNLSLDIEMNLFKSV